MAGGTDGFGDLFQRVAQGSQVQMSVDPAELFAGFDHAGGAPAQCHGPVAAAFDVAGVITTDGDHRFDTVDRAQGAGQGGGHV